MCATIATALIPELALLNDRVTRAGGRRDFDELRETEGIDNPELYAEDDERYRPQRRHPSRWRSLFGRRPRIGGPGAHAGALGTVTTGTPATP
ncbi:MAG TPA: hypothetical protein VFF67_00535 [Thermoplasmata archaeon]|nr:hypothetical protein [Thermoplasmata archaeon]